MPTTPPAATDAPTMELRTLAGVIERLASGLPLEQSLPPVLHALLRVLQVRELAVWQITPAGLTRSAGAGPNSLTAEQLRQVLQRRIEMADLQVMPLTTGDRRLGLLTVLTWKALPEAHTLLLTAVAQLVSSHIAQAERQQHWQVEVEAQTRELEDERRFTERIIDSLPVGLYVVDREYRVQAWNRKRETGMQGVSRDEAVGRPIFEVLHRQSRDVLQQELDEVFTTGRVHSFQVDSTSTGEVRTYRISKIPMRMTGAEVTHVVTIGEDVTEWKATEERIAQSEKLAAIGQLAAGVMHEINNPLATIAACAESLGYQFEDLAAAGAVVPEGTGELLRTIDDEVQRCKGIVDGLLDFSRPRRAHMEPVDVHEVLERTLFLLKHHARFKRLTVATTFDRSLPMIAAANAEQLVQVFMALLLNALDAMSDRGTVTIRTRRGGTAALPIVVEVVDTGVGIPRSEFTKIFEPFYTTKGAGEGTGLGLAICYGIVQEHGGRLEVDSVVGEGSTFRVLLPAGGGV